MRYWETCVILVTMAFGSSGARAGVIPAQRVAEWSLAGYPGEVPRPSTQADVMDFGAVGDGVANDQPAIVAAIASLGGEPGVVFLPPGNYRITSTISLPSGVVLRGAGAADSWIRCDPPNSGTTCIAVNGSVSGDWQAVTAGYSKDSQALTVSDGTAFSQGDWALIRQQNGSWDTKPIEWADNAVGQLFRVASVAGDVLSLDRPLRIDYDPALSPEIVRLNPKNHVGIEDLGIERASDPTTSSGYNINFYLAVDSWAKGIESDKSIGSHMMIRTSANVEVTGSHFHHAYTYDGSGTRGYGVTMSNSTSDCLVEGNIFDHLRHAMMVKVGCNGNVWAYNFSRDPYRSETFNDFAGDISLHGHYSFANLFEGNIVANIIIDQYWGASGPYNTFFRNRAEWYGIIITPDSSLTNDQNFVGNEVTKGKSNFLLGIYYTLYYGILGTGHFEHGNNVDGTLEPAGTGDLADLSYYRDEAGDFCEMAPNWPSIGVPNGLDSGTNRARQRWDAGGPMIYREIRVETGPNVTLDEGDMAVLAGEASGGTGPLTVLWTPPEGLDDPQSLTPQAGPMVTTTYTLTATDANGCQRTGTVEVTVNGVDECLEGTDTCDPNATCTDVPGGYECECLPGFVGDGWTCQLLCETVDCDDGDACTVDTCDPILGCQHAPVDCDDGSSCTEDTCDPLQGCQYVPVDCDDGDICTDDLCDPVQGCLHESVTCGCCGPCEEEVCDQIEGLGCVPLPVPGDGDPCTIDLCDPATGDFLYPAVECDDGDVCTVEACVQGLCEVIETVEGCCNSHEDCEEWEACDLDEHVCYEDVPEPVADTVEPVPDEGPDVPVPDDDGDMPLPDDGPDGFVADEGEDIPVPDCTVSDGEQPWPDPTHDPGHDVGEPEVWEETVTPVPDVPGGEDSPNGPDVATADLSVSVPESGEGPPGGGCQVTGRPMPVPEILLLLLVLFFLIGPIRTKT